MSIESLRKDIKDKNIGSLYLLYGEEDYEIFYYLKIIENLIINEDTKELNYIVLTNNVNEEEIFRYSNTYPAFAERKMVVVNDNNIFKKNTNLTEYIKNVPKETCLIFIAKSVDKRTALYKNINKTGCVVEFKLKKPSELVQWVIKYLNKRNLSIGMLEASYLIDISSMDMTSIINEINKLEMYVKDRGIIKKEDIEIICHHSIKSKIFNLIDAIAEKRKQKAMILLKDMIDSREPIARIIYMINRQLRLLSKIRTLINKNISDKLIANKLGVVPFIIKNLKKQAHSYTTEDLYKLINLSSDLDYSIKSGKIKESEAINLLIYEMSK